MDDAATIRWTERLNINCAFKIPQYVYQSAIYFLLFQSEVVYIGQSVNPCSRIQDHAFNKEFDEARIVPMDKSILLNIEGALIRLLKPKFNTIHHARGRKEEDERYLQFFYYTLRKIRLAT